MRCPFTLPPPSTLSHVTSCTCGCDRVFTCFFFSCSRSCSCSAAAPSETGGHVYPFRMNQSLGHLHATRIISVPTCVCVCVCVCVCGHVDGLFGFPLSGLSLTHFLATSLIKPKQSFHDNCLPPVVLSFASRISVVYCTFTRLGYAKT